MRDAGRWGPCPPRALAWLAPLSRAPRPGHERLRARGHRARVRSRCLYSRTTHLAALDFTKHARPCYEAPASPLSGCAASFRARFDGGAPRCTPVLCRSSAQRTVLESESKGGSKHTQLFAAHLATPTRHARRPASAAADAAYRAHRQLRPETRLRPAQPVTRLALLCSVAPRGPPAATPTGYRAADRWPPDVAWQRGWSEQVPQASQRG